MAKLQAQAAKAEESAKAETKIALHKKLDSDGDGKLSRAEMEGMIESVKKMAEA